MRVEDFLREKAGPHGARTALVAGNARLSFAELDRMAGLMATALGAQGIARDDRVVVFMDSSWEAVVSIVAILKAGASFIPVNPTTLAGELVHVLNNCRAAGLVTQSRLAVVTARAMAEAPALRLTVIAGCQGAPEIDGIMRFEDAIAGDAPAPTQAPAGIAPDLAALVHASGPAGIVISGAEAVVVDDHGAPVDPGITGELVIRGPDAAAPSSPENVLRTGDLFRADGEGFLYFVGRKSDRRPVEARILEPAEWPRSAVMRTPHRALETTIRETGRTSWPT